MKAMNIKKNKTVLAAILAIVVFGALAALWYASTPKNAEATPSLTGLDTFASCLSEKGFTMYGLYSCPHCQAEKALFGDSFRHISYVECSEDPQKCVQAGIEGVPTWVGPDGKRLVGTQSLESLSAASGCALPNGN